MSDYYDYQKLHRLAEEVIDQEKLEALLDRYGLECMLDMLAAICFDKAKHIRENWQDRPLARAWDEAANKVGKIAMHRFVTAISARKVTR